MSVDPSSVAEKDSTVLNADSARAPVRDALGRLVKGSPPVNPGGRTPKAQRDLVARLKSDDIEEIYAAFMGLVRLGHPTVVMRAMEYAAGKPREVIDVTVSKESGTLDLGKLSDAQLDDLARLVHAAKGTDAPPEL